MMDHLSDILNGAVSTTPDEPCFVIRQDSSFCEQQQVDDCTIISSNHDVGGFDEDENVKSDDELASTAVTTAILRCLSYRQAQDALWQHQFWLAAQAEQKIRLATAAGGGGSSTSSSTAVVVVAYLASNSMDYILSVMACSSPITTGATTTPCNTKEEEKSHRQRFLPALLNTRWTANEAVAALILRGNDDRRRRRNNRSRSSSTTLFLLLLYGPGFELMANNIVTKLNNHNNDNDTAARICGCLPIPTLAMQIAMSGRPQQVFVQPQLQQQKFRTTRRKDVASCTGKVDSSSCRPVRPGVHKMIIDAQDEIQRLEDTYYKRRPFSRNHCNCRIPDDEDDDDDDDDDTALIVFTSGTTSAAAKGVKLSHASILIQALAKLTAPCRYNTETVLLISPSAVPFFHVGGLTSILAVWLAGGTLLQMQSSSSSSTQQQQQQQQSGAFDPEIVLQSLQPAWMASPSYIPPFLCCYCNTLVLVPAMLHALQQQQHSSSNIQQRQGRHVKKFFYPFVTLVLIGGQSASPTQLDFARQCFPNARLVQTYACTEAASSITFCNVTRSNAPRPAKAAPISMMPMTTTSNTVTTAGGAENYLSSGDCVGQPPSHIQVALLRIPPHWKQDQHDSSSATTRSRNQPPKISSNMMISQPWQVGVIATRGPHVMNGYWRDNTDINSNDCNDDITCDGWLITNDLGFWASDSKNDNNTSAQPDLYFCGRTTDTIRTGGETVMALEVERILLQHPSIDQVAVFGVPDEQYGQAVACAIVLVTSTDNNNNNNNNTENRHHHSLLLLDQVRQWCKQRGLAGYKCPRHVFYMTQLPRNSSGKVLKMHLRERFGHASSSRVIASKL
jgi:acyl-CoA synthetase (AMP-forming)/AMP-acid ligase II